MSNRAIVANLYHAPQRGSFEYIEQACIEIDATGTITQVLSKSDHKYDEVIANHEQSNSLTRLAKNQYLLPGLVDLHTHAPQWPQAGKGLDLPLNDWLNQYTFPLENRYKDPDFTARIYPELVDTLIAHGTTTAMYFATIDSAPSEYLAQVCKDKGQRALVGKISMDEKSMCPEYYVESSTEVAISAAETFIQNIREIDNQQNLIHPVVTPRFVPTSTKQLLEGLGKLVQKYQCHVQTHASESDWARDFTQQAFQKTDVELYEETGLLTRKTVLAHSIFLTQSDKNTIKEVGAGIAHCPLSNMYFADAAFPLREALDQGLHVGLGSDLSGGPLPSIFHAALDAVSHSRVREAGTNTHIMDQRGEAHSRVSFVEAFWLATHGGGLTLDLPVGIFKPGYYFDALVIDSNTAGSQVRIYDDLDSAQDALEKIIVHTTEPAISAVWVSGKQIK
ncbi:guanine deaminase [Vibrio maritimus]|uniref:guanine deaminase n=1 Tax=Vibrio maritimus TaxID=990268 RepID=UPI001F31B1B5|nr:guanine deaminase [Vibrio maritimus]